MMLGVIVVVFLVYLYTQRANVENMRSDVNTYYYVDAEHADNKPGKYAIQTTATPSEDATPACGEGDGKTPCDPAKFATVNLLPKSNDVVRDDAFEFAPKDLTSINFLDAKSKIGENSIGNSLRNPNLQLRSEPANPRTPVSPWQNSTIEPDLYRQPWE